MPIFTHTVIELASLAGAGQPESIDSPGAVFLIAIMDSVEDAIDRGETDADALTDLANDAPSGVIATRWAQFVDLAGWRIDTTDLTGDKISAHRLSEHAESVLFIIAETLIAALIAEHNGNKTEGTVPDYSPGWTSRLVGDTYNKFRADLDPQKNTDGE